MKLTKTKLKEMIREEIQKLNEAKEIYKVIFSDGNTMKVNIDKGKGEQGVLDFVKRIQTGKAGALSGAFNWAKKLKVKKVVKESKLIEAKVADSKGSPIEAGKWYRFTFGKRNQKIKVVSIDSKGIKFYDPQDDWKYTISMKMVNKRKIGGYMTPLKENKIIKEEKIPSKFKKEVKNVYKLYDSSSYYWEVITTKKWNDKRAAEFQKEMGWHPAGYGFYKFKSKKNPDGTFSNTWKHSKTA